MNKRALFVVAAGLCLFFWGIVSAEETPSPKTTPPRKSVKPVEKPSATPTPIAFGKNLLKNGDFESKMSNYGSPTNWQLCDGLTSFYESFPNRGKIIRIDTSVPKEQARERWQVMIEKGADAPPAPKKGELEGGKYSSIGAVDGVHFFSDPIPVNKGSYYKLRCDTKGRSADIFFTKIFVKGYAKVVKKRKIRQQDGSIKEESYTEERQVYKWYLACRSEKYEWKTFEDWLPSKMPQNIDFVKICIYAYWPNLNYYFDNLEFYEGKAPPEPKME